MLGAKMDDGDILVAVTEKRSDEDLHEYVRALKAVLAQAAEGA